MSARKVVVRGLVVCIAGGMVAAGYCYQCWTNPAAVRQEVVAKLQAHFPGAIVTTDNARMSLLGGIVVNELRLTRRDDPGGLEVLHVPSAVLHHDKEKLLDGGIALRKIVLDRPRLRLVRNHDGKWNVDGLAQPTSSEAPLPTIVVRQGTLIVDDRLQSGDLSAVELTDVNLTLINDPVPTVCFEGSATCALAGNVYLRGTLDRQTRALVLNSKVQNVPLNAGVLQRLACFFPCCKEADLAILGKADIESEISYCPGAQSSPSYDVRLHLREGRLSHPRLPLPLHDVEATLRTSNGLIRIEKLQAKSGQALVELTASAQLPCADKDFQASLLVRHLPMTEDFFARLPEKIRKLYDTFQPSGLATLRLECARRDGEWTALSSGSPPKVALLPENMSVCFHRFPYPVDRLTGTVEMDLITELVHVDTSMYSGASPIFVKGTWQGQGIDADARFDIVANDIPVDEKLLKALPGTMQKVVCDFSATARGNMKAHIRHQPGAAEWGNEYHVYFTDGSVQWQEFPYPLERMTGYLDIYPHHWEVRELKGHNQGSQVTINGFTTKRDAEGDSLLHLEIAGRNVGLDTDLFRALQKLPGLAKAWETFHPIGRLNFAARVDHPLPARPIPISDDRHLQKLDVAVDVQGCSIEPSFFPYVLEDLRGRFRYHSGRLDMTRLAARHGASEITLGQGVVDFFPNGATYADLKDLRASPLVPEMDLFDAMPASVQSSFASLKIKDPVYIQTRLIVSIAAGPASEPDVYWDGQIVVRNASMTTGVDLTHVSGSLNCIGRYKHNRLRAFQGKATIEHAKLLNQPLQWVYAQMQVKDNSPDVLSIDLRAPFFGGEVSGPIRVDFGDVSGRSKFDLDLTATQVDLQQFGRHNLGSAPNLQGTAVGKLHLTGYSGDGETLDGNGHIDIPAGAHIFNLPLLLDLLKFLGLRWPDRTAFEEAHAVFLIRGQRVFVRKLDLYGNAISLSGRGDFKIDGSDLRLDFYPSWGRMEQLLSPAGRAIPSTISKNLLKIEMRGKVGGNDGDLRFTKKPVPILVDPLLQMRDRMVGAK